MNEQKRKIGFTVACINEFASKHELSIKEAFQYLFQFKGIAFIKENYDVEHTLDFVIIYCLNLRFSQSKTKETLVQSESNISRRVINNE